MGTGNANTGQLMDVTGSQINGQERNESYNYDQVARLTQASGFYAQRNYTYDRWGNRTAMSGGASQTVTMQQLGGGVTKAAHRHARMEGSRMEGSRIRR